VALTREERQTIETLTKKVTALDDKVRNLESLNTALQKIVDAIDAESNILDWSSDQVDSWLAPYISDYMSKRGAKLSVHNHKDNQQGGSCFAKLGANLVD